MGNSSSPMAKRIINTKGGFSIVHKNRSARFSDTYDYLVRISWVAFFTYSLLAYVLANSIFALIYLTVGADEINIILSGNYFNDFLNSFSFSCQTFTSLGYGTMAPKGVLSGIISSIEAFLGLLFFAFVTGLLYGRFSKPKPSIKFSKDIVFRKFKNKNAIMFRVVNNRVNAMIKPEVEVNLSLSVQNEKGVFENNFYKLKLERKKITYLPTTWTIVHEIDSNSPLQKFTKEEIKALHGEFLILLTYYDEAFNQEVHQMYSYTFKDLKIDFKFRKAYYYNDKGEMIMDHDLFDALEAI